MLKNLLLSCSTPLSCCQKYLNIKNFMTGNNTSLLETRIGDQCKNINLFFEFDPSFKNISTHLKPRKNTFFSLTLMNSCIAHFVHHQSDKTEDFYVFKSPVCYFSSKVKYKRQKLSYLSLSPSSDYKGLFGKIYIMQEMCMFLFSSQKINHTCDNNASLISLSLLNPFIQTDNLQIRQKMYY